MSDFMPGDLVHLTENNKRFGVWIYRGERERLDDRVTTDVLHGPMIAIVLSLGSLTLRKIMIMTSFGTYGWVKSDALVRITNE